VGIAAVTGVSLAQIGEFSFVLERSGRAAGLSPAGMGPGGEQTFLAAAVLLMLLTPVAFQFAPRLAPLLQGRAPREDSDDAAAQQPGVEDHVVLIGYGPAGRRVANVLAEARIPFMVIDFNPASVRELAQAGHSGVYGDASRAHILEEGRIEHAKLVVVAIHDAAATRRIVQLARHLNPTAQIIVRTRFLREVEVLQEVGADVVVPEEMETTVRIFAHVLGAYMVPPDEVERYVSEVRAADYGILRGSIQEAHLMVLQGLDDAGLHTRAVAVRAGAPAAGRTLGELALRREHELTVISVRRGTGNHASPSGDFVVQADDRLLLVGTAEHFAAAAHLFRPPETPTV
jgi:CPA2 family monovalent cation:H+ antiporter-2